MNLPLVSISCITYNQEPYIRQALDGFLMQKTKFEYEILIYDDASTDQTAAIIQSYAMRYPDIIKPILQTENQYSQGITNISGHFNFPRAKGKYICMCEGDDYWTDSNKLQKQVDYLESHPDCSLCFHSAKLQIEDGSLTAARMRPYFSDRIVTPEQIIDKSSGYPTASLMFPALHVKTLPSYYIACPVGDIPLQLMLAAKGYGYYFDQDLCVYRVGGSQSWSVQSKQGNYIKKQQHYYEQMKATYEAFDQEEDHRFHEAVESAIARIHFLTWVNTRQYKQIMHPQYRKYYKELSIGTRGFMQLERMAPHLYYLLQRISHRLKK